MADYFDLIVIGTGPAGLTAAIYARRRGMRVAVFGDTPGGNIVKIEHVANYPGFIGGIFGAQLGTALFAQAQSEGAFLPMIRLDRLLPHENGFLGIAQTGEEYLAPAAVAAFGVVPRKLNIPNSDKKGIYYCSLCDGPLFRDKSATLAVLGGGNMAAHEALSLSVFAERVIIVNPASSLMAEEALVRQIEEKGNIEVLLNANIEAFHAGEGSIDGITVSVCGSEKIYIAVSGVFMAIGWGADLGVIQIPVETTQDGFLKTDAQLMTSTRGLFAAGDVRDTDMRQIVTACADGARVASYAFEYVSGKKR